MPLPSVAPASPLPWLVADATATDDGSPPDALLPPESRATTALSHAVPCRDAAFNRGVDVDRSVLATDVHLFSASPLTDRASLMCYRCGELGHVKSECMSWRIRQCVHFDKGYCTRVECPFAHGACLLRTPWALKCVRIVKVDHGFVDLGCGSSSHSFRHCPHTSKLVDHKPHARFWSASSKARRSPMER